MPDRKFSMAFSLFAAFLSLALAGCNSTSRPPGPGINAFTASTNATDPLNAVTLTWALEDRTASVSIDQGVGDVTGRTSVRVFPSASTTYTLTATNTAGSNIATATATLPPPRPSPTWYRSALYSEVWAVAWSSDGSRFAAASTGVTRIFNASDGDEVALLRVSSSGAGGSSTTLAWSPDSTRLALADRLNGPVAIFDTILKRPIRELEIPTGVQSLAWGPDGRSLAAAVGSDLIVWDTSSWSQRFEVTNPDSPVPHATAYQIGSLAWSPDGKRIAGSVEGKAKVRFWEASTGASQGAFEDPTDATAVSPQPIAWSPDGKRLVAGGTGGLIKIYDAATGNRLQNIARSSPFPGASSVLSAVSWNRDSRRFVTSGDYPAGNVSVWDANTGQLAREQLSQTGAYAVAFSPASDAIAVGTRTSVRLVDADLNDLGMPAVHLGDTLDVALDPSGALLATGGADAGIVVREAATGRALRRLAGHAGNVNSLTWSPDGSTLASGSADKTIRLWDPRTGQTLRSWDANDDWILAVAWSPDGSMLASAGYDGLVKLWNPASGALVRTLTGHFGPVESLAWSPDGSRLATGGDDQSVRIWDPATGAQTRRFSGNNQGHNDQISAVRWRPDGKVLASGDRDGAVKLWDPATGDLIRDLVPAAYSLRNFYTLAWSPDGSDVIGSGTGGGLVVWASATGAVVRPADGLLNGRAVVWRGGTVFVAGPGADGVQRWELNLGK